MQMNWLRSAGLSAGLAVFAGSLAFADETAHVHVEADHHHTPVEQEVSFTDSLIAEVEIAADAMRQASFEFLAAAGDRDTSNDRKAASRWAMEFAQRLKSDLKALDESEEDLIEAGFSHEANLKQAETILADEISALETEIESYGTETPNPLAVDALPLMKEAAEALKSAKSQFHFTRPLHAEIHFANWLEGAEIASVHVALRSSFDSVGTPIEFELDEHAIHVRGKVTQDLTSAEVRDLIMNSLELADVLANGLRQEVPAITFMLIEME